MSALNSQLQKIIGPTVTVHIDQGDQRLTDTYASHAVNTKESVTQLVSAIISEQQEKERRQLNIVVHNIEESSSDPPQV